MDNVTARKSKALERMKKFQAEKGWKKTAMKIAVRILTILEEKQMTQKDLSEMLKKSPQWVNKICKGKQNLTIDTIHELEDILGEPLVEIPERTSKNVAEASSLRL